MSESHADKALLCLEVNDLVLIKFWLGKIALPFREFMGKSKVTCKCVC